jgi:predicted AAA+ superfamily ATPase
MEDQDILKDMSLFNPWWTGPSPELEKGLIQREVFHKLLDALDDNRILALVGPRRIGKTTAMKQVIWHLLDTVEPVRILYFSMDAMKREDRIIRRIFDLYFRNILKQLPGEGDKVYIFLDEVQKINDWGEEVKSLHDRGYPVKFIVTGSSAMYIMRGSGESLVGRIDILRVFPFSFREFLKYQGIETHGLSAFDLSYPPDAEKIKLLFDKYALIGGYPELYPMAGQERIRDYIKTVLDLTFYRDMVNLFEVKRADVLEGMFYSFVKESGNVINYHTLTNNLNTKYETVKTYIEYLASSFFISRSYLYSKSTLKSFRKNPKIYADDNAFFRLIDTKEGLKIETAVYNHLKHLGFELFYWQNKARLEVDILLQTPSGLLPIEVKYGKNISKGDVTGLLACMNELSSDVGIIVTSERIGLEDIGGKQVNFIPAWMFLMCEEFSI